MRPACTRPSPIFRRWPNVWWPSATSSPAVSSGGAGTAAPGAALPRPVAMSNGGGLSYMHSGMYGMYALQESVRQMRGIAPAQVPNAKISVCHGVGGMFAASGTIIFTNEK